MHSQENGRAQLLRPLLTALCLAGLVGCAAPPDAAVPVPPVSAFAPISPPLMVAVIAIEDKTGSTRPSGSQNFADPSRAVSQGAVEMLKHMLAQAPFNQAYDQMDRQNLAELLTERRIAEQFNVKLKESAGLPPADTVLGTLMAPMVEGLITIDELRPVDYLLSGAVVGYDPNITDDGYGLMVNGVGVTERRRTDRISVVLYMTEVQSGRVVASTHKQTIVGASMRRLSAMGYPVADRLFEIEGGRAVNDAVTDELIAAFYLALIDLTAQMREIQS
jgi:curli production assembly/transport component CsgG